MDRTNNKRKLQAIRKFSRDELRQSFRNVSWGYRGKVCDVVGTIVEAMLPNVNLGSIVELEIPNRKDQVIGEVVGFRKNRVLVLPYNHLSGVSQGCAIKELSSWNQIPAGDFLLGQVIDPFMNSLSKEKLKWDDSCHQVDLDTPPPNPLERQRISHSLSMGVRAIDGTLTFGQGQRIGIMAGSGVGKSVLMGMIAKNAAADINVIALIGERGREVREFIEKDLGEEGLKRSVIVTVTSDQSPLMRIRGAKVATSIAEYFSSQGKNVMLMMDSLTRIALAQREIGNAIGEPPTTKGYTPSVFSLLPKLLERSGPQIEGRGSISGLYTVLVDGDDFNDPIADATRSILDGHINLSRSMAAKGHFPAIDISTSSSRVMRDIVAPHHWDLALKLKGLLGIYQENIDLIQIGAYQSGTNPQLDEAIKLMPHINSFLKQDMNEFSDLGSAIDRMIGIMGNSNFDNTLEKN
ncbi:MAG: hypothetical protein CMP10_20495 [Zetaproteobacteria bacterium]|nr:hypothetical protein [Pseudobdellovibrionaceae bacterium]